MTFYSIIGKPAPFGKGYVEKPYTNCKFCKADLDATLNMMYYCDTACYYKQNITGQNIDSHCAHKETMWDMTLDCVYCTDCFQWLEPKCGDDDCEFCSKRTSDASHLNYFGSDESIEDIIKDFFADGGEEK